MDYLMIGLAGICTIVSIVCFVMVIIKMFQHGKTGVAIASILLIWCIGGLIALIVGWQNADAWGIKNVMIAWTVAIVAGIVINIAMGAMGIAIPGMPAR